MKIYLKKYFGGEIVDLKCKKLDCVNNNRYSCTCEGICVSKQCDCKSYEKSSVMGDEQKQDVSKTMFETAPDIHPYRHKKEVKIDCDACGCLFNEEKNCRANGICVCDEEKNAICSTFIKK